MGYHLTTNEMARFRDKTYVPDSSEIKNVGLREFHVKPYLGHSVYHNALTTLKKLYYWLNFKTDVVEFVTKVVHFIPVKSTFLARDVAQVFIRDVVILRGVSKKIV